MTNIATIYIRNTAEISFTYNDDADNGLYVVSGPGAADVYAVLRYAIQNRTKTTRLPPITHFNPQSFLWVLAIVENEFRNVTVAKTPGADAYPQHKKQTDETDADGLPLIY